MRSTGVILHVAGLLDQELWVAAEVPASTQAVVDGLEHAAAGMLPSVAHAHPHQTTFCGPVTAAYVLQQ